MCMCVLACVCAYLRMCDCHWDCTTHTHIHTHFTFKPHEHVRNSQWNWHRLCPRWSNLNIKTNNTLRTHVLNKRIQVLTEISQEVMPFQLQVQLTYCTLGCGSCREHQTDQPYRCKHANRNDQHWPDEYTTPLSLTWDLLMRLPTRPGVIDWGCNCHTIK